MERTEFREAQAAAWDAAAGAWEKWWPTFHTAAQDLNQLLVEMAEIKPGSRVLDIACGLGEPSLTAARCAGDGGSVVGLDLSTEMVRIATERAKSEQIHNVQYHAADAEEFEFEAGSFDAATCRWALMLMQEPERTLAAVHRALKPGGILAAAVWAESNEAPLLAMPRDNLAAILGQELPPIEEPGVFRFGSQGSLEEVLQAAEFEILRSQTFEVVFNFDSPPHYRTYIEELSTGIRKALSKHTQAERDRYWSALEDSCSAHTLASGKVELKNKVHCVAAKRV